MVNREGGRGEGARVSWTGGDVALPYSTVDAHEVYGIILIRYRTVLYRTTFSPPIHVNLINTDYRDVK